MKTSTECLEGLNEAQQAAVTHENGPLLIVAGAGTGKTTVLARRYVWLLTQQHKSSENILTLTFTEKASQEMEDRVLQLLPHGTYDFWISTFHGFCQRILEEFALEIGLPNHFRLITETDGWLLLKRRIEELPLDHYRPLGNPVKFLSSLLTHFSRAKDEGISVERYSDFARNCMLDGDTELVDGERKRLMEVADCYAAYRKILREEGCLDFGDLIVETLRLLRERPTVLQMLRARFTSIMIDEFQDTNWAQYELVKLLAGNEKNITVVGDDDQAIYKFRGASLANILQFRDDYPDAKTIALTENYRSRQEILDVAYQFISKNNPHRLEVQLQGTGLNKKLSAAQGAGGHVAAKWYSSLDDETTAIAETLKRLKKTDPTLTWNDFTILVRSNDGAAPFVRTLEQHGIPFRFFALRGLYSKPIVVDLIALLQACESVHDSTSVWRVLSFACYNIPARDVAEIMHMASRRGLSLWLALKQAGIISALESEGIKRFQKIVHDIESLAETAKRDAPLKVLQYALEKTGILASILQLPEEDKIEQIRVLNAFADRVKRYEASRHGATLHGFLEELKLEIESGEEGALDVDPDAGPELVKIMTVHASKGLEFRHVFVVSLVDQRFPTRARTDALPLPEGLVNERLPEGDAHLEEERRLLYVAMTRAKETLTLTGAEQYGGARKKKPSVFFDEISVALDRIERTNELHHSLTVSEVILERESAERESFPLKRRFSFTQLAAFRNCPLQYKFAHVYRVPILGSFQRSFGQSVHLTLHDILKFHDDRGRAQQATLFAPVLQERSTLNGLRVSLEEALQIYEDRWIDEWYQDRKQHDRYKQEGREGVRRMWQAWNEAPPIIRALEQPFDWKIGEHSLKGSVDRIDEILTGGVAIYDYKTGEPKSSDDLETSQKEQLRIYQLAMEDRGYSVKKLAYIYIRDGSEAVVDILQGEKRQAFITDIEARMGNILTSRFLPQPSIFTCKNCDFRHICEFRKL